MQCEPPLGAAQPHPRSIDGEAAVVSMIDSSSECGRAATYGKALLDHQAAALKSAFSKTPSQ
jgi:hypothetical protein